MRKIKNLFDLENISDLPEFFHNQFTKRKKERLEEKDKFIKNLLNQGYNQSDVARLLKISRQAVSEYIKKRNLKGYK